LTVRRPAADNVTVVIRPEHPLPVDRGRAAGLHLPRRRPVRLAAVAVVVGAAAMLASLVGGSPGWAQQGGKSPRQAFDEAQAAVTAVQGRLDVLFAARRELDVEGMHLSYDQHQIADRLEEARGKAEALVLAAYMEGSGPVVEDAVVYQEPASDIAYKTYFVADRAARARAAVEAQRAAFAEVDADIADFVVRRGANASALDQANGDLERALAVLREADAAFRQAEHEAAEQARAAAAAQKPPPFVSSGGSRANANGPGWDALRKCESGGNYGAVDPSGTYRGAYQFDRRTWAGLGGTGDPAAAAPAEQDYRAQLLFNQRGAQPWPVCGRSLANDASGRAPAVPPS
jgi:hypothetical protein